MEKLFSEVIRRANRYVNELETRGVNPTADAIEKLKRLDVPLQDQPIDPMAVLSEDDVERSLDAILRSAKEAEEF